MLHVEPVCKANSLVFVAVECAVKSELSGATIGH